MAQKEKLNKFSARKTPKKKGIKVNAKVLTLVVMAVTLLAAMFFSEVITYEKPPQEEPLILGDVENRASVANLSVLAESGHTGLYYEDGQNKPVENVAAILLKNNSEEFLDRAVVEYDISGKRATFIATGLPPGKAAWVQEQNKLTLGPSETFTLDYDSVEASFNNTARLTTDDIELDLKDNTLTVTNITEKPLVNVCVYYKNLGSDGNYLGGITYMIAFDRLGPGEELTKQSQHFGNQSDIVKYSYQFA